MNICENPIFLEPKYVGDNQVYTWNQDHTVTGKKPDNVLLRRTQDNKRLMVPCGKCIPCKERVGKEFAHRMMLEAKTHGKNIAYVTLTFNEPALRRTGEHLHKEEVQLFLKRLRKQLKGRRIKYFCAGEYGPSKLRKHYHLILFGVDGKDRLDNFSRMKMGLDPILKNDDWTKIHKSWKNGFSKIERPRGSGAYSYLASYVVKISKNEDRIKAAGYPPEFRMMSNGLGRDYIIRLARLVNQKKKRITFPLTTLEYRYKDKNGVTKTIRRGLGRWLSNLFHELTGKKSIYEIWKKLKYDEMTIPFLNQYGKLDPTFVRIISEDIIKRQRLLRAYEVP